MTCRFLPLLALVFVLALPAAAEDDPLFDIPEVWPPPARVCTGPVATVEFLGHLQHGDGSTKSFPGILLTLLDGQEAAAEVPLGEGTLRVECAGTEGPGFRCRIRFSSGEGEVMEVSGVASSRSRFLSSFFGGAEATYGIQGWFRLPVLLPSGPAELRLHGMFWKEHPLTESEVQGTPEPRGLQYTIQVLRLHPGTVPPPVVGLTAQSVREWKRAGGVEVLRSATAPFAGDQAMSFAFLREVHHVADYDVEVAQGAFICDPVKGVLLTGLRVAILPGEVAPLLRWRRTVLDRMEEFRTSLGALANPVTIQIPRPARSGDELELREDATVVPLANLVDGTTLALLVVREP
jgi:hypothetical protein